MAQSGTLTAHRSAVNCYSLNSTGRVEVGLYLTIGGISAENQRTLPPHLKVGEQFVGLNKRAPCMFNEQGLVMLANLQQITPPRKRSFDVLSYSEGREPGALLYIHTGLRRGRFLDRITDLKIWYGVEGTARIIRSNNGEALVEFKNLGEYIHVMYQSGLVTKIVFSERGLEQVSLTEAGMAEVRVMSMRNNIEKCDPTEDGIRRRYGILFGAINLLPITKRNPEARDVILDFLDEQGGLSEPMREKVRLYLLELGDRRAIAYADDGFFASVTRGSGRPEAANARKARKAEESREIRKKMKKTEGSSNKKQITNPKSKVAKRRARKVANKNKK